MSFMQKQITSRQHWLEVETTHGTEFLPQELVANVANCYEDAEDDNSFNEVQKYTEGEPQSWKWIEGYGARMSAPGYMDCTEWCVFDTQEEAEQYLKEMYGDDEQ